MYREAPPYIEPNMSNLLRLYGEKMRRDCLKGKHHDMTKHLDNALNGTLVQAFTQEAKGNAPSEIRVFLMRIFEAALAKDHRANGHARTSDEIARELQDFTKSAGLDAQKTATAIETVKTAAQACLPK